MELGPHRRIHQSRSLPFTCFPAVHPRQPRGPRNLHALLGLLRHTPLHRKSDQPPTPVRCPKPLPFRQRRHPANGHSPRSIRFSPLLRHTRRPPPLPHARPPQLHQYPPPPPRNNPAPARNPLRRLRHPPHTQERGIRRFLRRPNTEQPLTRSNPRLSTSLRRSTLDEAVLPIRHPRMALRRPAPTPATTGPR